MFRSNYIECKKVLVKSAKVQNLFDLNLLSTASPPRNSQQNINTIMNPFPNISSGWAVKADEQHHDNADQNGYVKLTHEMSSKKIIKIVCIFCLQFLSKETLSNSHHKNGKIYHTYLLYIFITK